MTIKRNKKKSKSKSKRRTFKGGKTQFFDPNRCSPISQKEGLGFTCMDKGTLKDVTKKLGIKKQLSDHNLEDVYESMKQKLQSEYDCKTEACLLKKLLSSQKKKNYIVLHCLKMLLKMKQHG